LALPIADPSLTWHLLDKVDDPVGVPAQVDNDVPHLSGQARRQVGEVIAPRSGHVSLKTVSLFFDAAFYSNPGPML
jgi:hypothetical protein